MATRKHSPLNDFLSEHVVEFSEGSERLTALYSDFSKLSLLNTYAYESNVGFWRRVILDCNQQGYLGCADYALAIEKQVLADQFQRPVIGKPLSLDCVVEHMMAHDELVSLEEFNQRYSPPSTWLGWVYDTVVKNAWHWRWRNDLSITHHTHYIVLPTLQRVCKEIMPRHLDSILTLTQFKQLYTHHFTPLELTDADITLVLRYLHAHYGVALGDIKGYGTTYMMIKFPSRQGETAHITQHDEAVTSIRTTCHALSVQVDELQQKSEELQKQSLQEKKLGRTSKALYCLKRRNNLLQVLEKRLKSMETMDAILLKIETSKDDIQVVQAFNLGADALKEILGDDGLTLESVDEAMQKIQQALEDQKEIEDALYTGNNDISEYNDQDIENELSQLIQEEAKVSSPSSSPKKASSPKKVSSPPKQENIHSELSRLNQMFSSVPSVPKNTTKREKELA